ncbi:hypothetical protein [Nostoc sp. 'Peltigera membranacea cyanobiont' N6]|uniref:hypothetical protein n=1 Tax=Nostoc sp. 'Peltigera membranacea cyanobiont' N6 TaxID=1261031 RepID=UPI000CF33CF9|nr:hypothetical protein [Nostoc sp. 'Peltigera membranacea cyanobiont' N6]AVH61891.1 hypothetical protein NPM_0002 [Nostoc sp. 'Peltigera membranacea cyanobiont' N6]
MKILFSQKFRLTLGCAALLLVSLASSYLYTQPKTKQLAQQNQSLTQPDKFAPLQSQISLTSKFQNSFGSQKISSDEIIGKPNAILSRQDLISASAPYSVVDEFKKYKFSINGSQVVTPSKLPSSKVNFEQEDLLTVLVNTRKYFQDYSSEDPDILRTGMLATQGVTVPDVLNTLNFMIAVLKEDIANNRATRLQDPNFINTNFRVIKWSAYNPKNKQQKQLRITKYAVFTHPGSRNKTSTFNTPIYSLKENANNDKFYTKYTKQDVLSGIYEPGGREFGKVTSLAYLTRNGLEEAIMEGTILINFTDGYKAFFNVDRNNGMAYIRGLKATAQKRYWYFREVDAIKGYGYKIDAKISIKPGVTFAGDVLNIGLGKVVVIEHTKGGRKYLRMGVITDTGGAFLPNLYQLDFLAGIFKNKQEFGQNIAQLPEYATAYFLIKK